MVKKHLQDEHRPVREVSRRIHRLLMPTIANITVAGVEDALVALVSDGDAYEGTGFKGSRTVGLAPAVVVKTAKDRAVEAWLATPSATVREIADLVGCGHSVAGSARSLAMAVDARPVTAESCPVTAADHRTDAVTGQGQGGKSVRPLTALPIGAQSGRTDNQPVDESGHEALSGDRTPIADKEDAFTHGQVEPIRKRGRL
ncbi:MAG: hypothetical protein H0W83_01185 [Planctomycetes bacterium]|nr:hypothetical protein [Planctomycetota bacterium]